MLQNREWDLVLKKAGRYLHWKEKFGKQGVGELERTISNWLKRLEAAGADEEESE